MQRPFYNMITSPRVHSVKNYIEGANSLVLHLTPNSPDTALLDYHLFRSMQSALSIERFSSTEELQNWVDNWIAQKKEFFFCVIHSLPKSCAKVIASNGKYFK